MPERSWHRPRLGRHHDLSCGASADRAPGTTRVRETRLRIEPLERDIRLLGCEDLEACLPTVLAGMPYSIVHDGPSVRPFASVVGSAGRYRLHAPELGAPSYQSDAVNAACDLAGLVARQYVWGRADRVALHAAAVVVNGSLMLFPTVPHDEADPVCRVRHSGPNSDGVAVGSYST